MAPHLSHHPRAQKFSEIADLTQVYISNNIILNTIQHMIGSRLRDKIVLLGTGARSPLFEVASALSLLDVMLAGRPEERECVFALRTTCLTGATLPERIAGPLIEDGVLRSDGTVDPVVREVVLAALRGEGEGLFVVSPFTDPLDRAVSDLIISQMKVEALLPPEQLAELFPTPPSEPGTWGRRMKKNGTDTGTGTPPPSRN